MALVACYGWDRYPYLDLITIRDFDRITTARVRTGEQRVEVFAPETVVWAYQGAAEPALRGLLGLVHPAHPDAPGEPFAAPAGLVVPREQQRPMTIQVPPAGRKQARARRLAAQARAQGHDLAAVRATSSEVRGQGAG